MAEYCLVSSQVEEAESREGTQTGVPRSFLWPTSDKRLGPCGVSEYEMSCYVG